MITTTYTFGVSQNYNTRNIDKALLENADMVVLLSNENHDITSQSTIVSEYQYVYTILNPKAKDVGDVNIPYSDKISTIKNLKIEYYDAGGKLIKKIKKKEIQDRSSYSNSNMADDQRFLSYSNSHNRYPYSVSISYTKESKYSAVIPSFNAFPYGDYVKCSVKNSRFTITGSVEDIQYKPKNLEQFKEYLSIENLPMNIEVKDLPALQSEKYSPKNSSVLPMVFYARNNGFYNTTQVNFTDWQSYGRWMYDSYLKDKYKLSNESKAEVQEIVAGLTSDVEKAKKIYDYVVNNTRYISIQLGEGGLEPFAAEDVHEKKYGDCKALSMYSLALMKEAGLKAFYTVIEAETEYVEDFEVDFANIQQGNHIIIGVDFGTDTIYADCTSNNVPFGEISSFTDGRLAVGINETGGKLIRTNKYTDQENSKTCRSDISVDGNSKEFKINVKSSISGHRLSTRIYFDKYSLQEKATKIYPHLYPYFSKETIEGLTTEFDGRTFSEEFSVSTKKFISSAGNYLMIPFHVHKLDRVKVSEDRRTPLYFKDGFVNTYITTVNIPEGYEWTGGIEKQVLESSFGRFEVVEIQSEGNTIRTKIEVSCKSGTFSEELTSEYNTWVTAIDKLENQNIVLRPVK